MNFWKKKAPLACTLLLTALTACNGGGQTDRGKIDLSEEIKAIEEGKIDRITLTWMIPTQQSIVLGNTPALKAAAEKFDINLVIKEEPAETHTQNLTLGLAGNTLTDIISWVTNANANTYGPVGAYMNLRLYEDEMKYFTPLRDAAVAQDPSNYNMLYNTDGDYYITPHYLDEPINLFDFSINHDLFLSLKDKYHLTWAEELPSTWGEIEEVLAHYKEEYEAANPRYECFPLTFRNFQSMAKELQLFVESFTEGQASTLDFFGFNEAQDKFEFALNVDGYKEAVAKYADWTKKGLISPDKTADENNLKNQVYYEDCIMLADYIGGWSGINYIQRDVGYRLCPLQIPKANGKRRVLGREVHNFDPLVGTALNRSLSNNKEKLARALVFLDYLYSDEFTENLWYNDDVTTKEVPAEKAEAPLEERRQYFRYNNETVYNFEEGFDYLKIKDTYFPWSLCNGFRDFQEERPDPNKRATSWYIDYRDNVLRAPYKEGYDRATSPYFYGKSPTVLLTNREQETVLNLETGLWDRFKVSITDFTSGKKNMESDWNAFVENLLRNGGNEMIEIYNRAYQRKKS
ncbi:MAG: extracellular solute-binding protein [Bacilli bacterium]|nr:extracellular solute-binding protein [Bacilli bacterium]